MQTDIAQASDGSHEFVTKIESNQLECRRDLPQASWKNANLLSSRRHGSVGKWSYDSAETEGSRSPGSSGKQLQTRLHSRTRLERVCARCANNLIAAPAGVLGKIAADGGGYVDLDNDGHWWASSGRVSTDSPAASALQEKSDALQHFFLPHRFVDPFGKVTTVDSRWPSFAAGGKKHQDALPGALANVTTAANNYRVLQQLLTGAQPEISPKFVSMQQYAVFFLLL